MELRDGDSSKFHGQGVLRAVANVKEVIGPALINKGFRLPGDVETVDEFMIQLDATDDKGKLGANAILGVSMACWRAAASAKVCPWESSNQILSSLLTWKKASPLYQMIQGHAQTKTPLVMPVPFFNVLNGGVHSGNNIAFQEFMIAPVGATSTTEAIRMGSEVYQELKSTLKKKFGGSAIGIGDEGGFAPPISHPHEALDLITTAVSNCGYNGKIKFAIDPASSEFFEQSTGEYNLAFKRTDISASVQQEETRSTSEMAKLYHGLMDKYPIALLEDPFAQDDWQSWTDFNKNCPIPLVGDDLLATNKKRIEMAHKKKACNALLLKINQIGTITEALNA